MPFPRDRLHLILSMVFIGLMAVTYNNCSSGLSTLNSEPSVSSGTEPSTLTLTPTPTFTSTPTPTMGAIPQPLIGLHVVMGTGGAPGHIVNGSGQVVQLRGVNHTYTEDSCTTAGGGTFSDGHLNQADLTEMKTWNINVVRVPLNEDCWLGLNGVPMSSSAYQIAVTNYVHLITSNGMAVILDLHWAAPGATQSQQGIEQVTMADQDHALSFWNLVSTQFASQGASDNSMNSMVLFDLFNEPNIGKGTSADWTCWLSGGDNCPILNAANSTMPNSSGTGPGVAVGMGTLLQKIRSPPRAAQNIVLLEGLGGAYDLTQWVQAVNSIPAQFGIPLSNIAASWHIYSDSASYNHYQYSCPNQWNQWQGTCPSALQTAENSGIPAVLAAGFPVIVGESGINAENPALAAWYTNLLSWLDAQGQNYLSWTWNTDAGPDLLTNYDYSHGVPSYTTLQGKTFYDHLRSP